MNFIAESNGKKIILSVSTRLRKILLRFELNIYFFIVQFSLHLSRYYLYGILNLCKQRRKCRFKHSFFVIPENAMNFRLFMCNEVLASCFGCFISVVVFTSRESLAKNIWHLRRRYSFATQLMLTLRLRLNTFQIKTFLNLYWIGTNCLSNYQLILASCRTDIFLFSSVSAFKYSSTTKISFKIWRSL